MSYLRTTIFQVKAGHKLSVKDIKIDPDRGRDLVLDARSGAIDLRTLPGVDPSKVATSANLQEAMRMGVLFPVAMDPKEADAIFGGQSEAPSAKAQTTQTKLPHLMAPPPVKLPRPETKLPEPPPKEVETVTASQAISPPTATVTKATMPISGKEGTVIMGNPLKTIAEMHTGPVVIPPPIRNKFLRLKGMKGAYVDMFAHAGVGHPRDLVKFRPNDILSIIGLAPSPENDSMVAGWQDAGAQMIQEQTQPGA